MSGNKPDHASQSGEAEDLVLDQRVEPEKPKDLGRDGDDDALVLSPTMSETALKTPTDETIDRDEIVDQAAKDHDIDEPIAASDSDDAEENAVIGDDVVADESITVDDDFRDRFFRSSRDAPSQAGNIIAPTAVGEGEPAGDESAPDDTHDETAADAEGDGPIRLQPPFLFGISAPSDGRADADETDIPAEVEVVSQRDADETTAADALEEFPDTNSGPEEQTGDPDDPADVVAMPDPQDLEDTIRRVVREELSGEMGRRLSLNIQRIIRDEVTRAMRSRG